MKKLVSVFIAIIAFSAMMFTSCQKEDSTYAIELQEICFSTESMLLEAGESSEVTVIAYYTNGIKDTVTSQAVITCSDASALKYEEGKVTALKDGKVTLNATYENKKSKCEITTSTIEKIEFSVAGEDDDIYFIPGESVQAEDISVVAYYKAGGSKEVSATITAGDPNIVAVYYDESDEVSEIAVAKVQTESTQLRAAYTTANGTTLTDNITVYVAQLDSAEISLDISQPEAERDTLLLGSTANVVVTGHFSYPDADPFEADARGLVEYFSFNERIFYVDSTKYTIDAIGLTPKPNYNLISAKLLGNKFISSKRIDVVSDPDYTLDPVNPYKVHTDVEYAYDNDIVTFKFTEEYVSKDGQKTKSINLTNTGNTDITSGYYITEPETTFCNPSLIKLCTGKIQMGEQVSTHATLGVNNEDSTGVFVIYKTSSKIDTVYSNQFKLYTHPQLAYSSFTQGMYGESIVLNWFANHLWEDEAEVVDNFGNRYTVANGGITPVTNVQKTECKVYILPLAPHMYNRTYTFTYGPEKRQCMITIGNRPQN